MTFRNGEIPVYRVRRIGSDCTSGDERSRSEAIYIDTAELVSQTATLRRPYALLPATTGVQSVSGAQVRRGCTLRCLAILLPLGRLLLHCRRLPHVPLPLALRKPKLRGGSETSWRTGD